jgi:hypothetical protein
MAPMTRRRLWFVAGLVLLAVVLRFGIRWADATARLPAPGELGIAALTVLLLGALVAGVVLLVRRGQTRKNR